MLKGTRSRFRLTVLAALAVAATGLTAVPARAVVSEVRAGGDYRLSPTANDAPARGKTAPGMAVNPANANHIVEVHHDLATQRCEFNRSLDGGVTWFGGGALPPPVGFPADSCPAIDHGGQSLGQQSVAFGSAGRVYVTWASKGPLVTEGFSVLLSISMDGGGTFANPVLAMVGGLAGDPSFADPELVVEPRPVIGDRIYISARDTFGSKAMVAVSADSGVTFGPPVQASQTSAPAPVWNGTTLVTPGDAFVRATELSQPVLGPQTSGGRTVYLAWLANKNEGACPPSCETLGETLADGYIVVARSTDNGLTWTRSRAVNVRGGILLSGDGYGPGSASPRLAVNGQGDLYMVFNQGPGVGGSNGCSSGTCPAYGPQSAADQPLNWDRDVYFLRSLDGGSIWGSLQKLNAPKRTGLAWPEVIQTRSPQVFVAPDGRLDIVWQDRRHTYLGPSDRKATPMSVNPSPTSPQNFGCLHAESNCPEARLADIYYARSRDRGVTFTANRRLDDRSRNLEVGYPHRVGTPRDYGPVMVHLGTDQLLVADVDSRLGNATNNSQDIFLRRLNLNAGGPIPTSSPVAGAPPALSVALSQQAYPGGSEAVPGERADGPRPWTRPVIVNEADYPAALAGGVLARANLGPVLATPSVGLPDAVGDEVDRLDPVGAYIIGDVTKVAAQVETDLVARGVPILEIVRVPGGTPAEIAANIALTLDRRRAVDKASNPPLPAFDAVVIANPNSASAASASVLAANRRLPILYVDQNAVPAVTASAITQLNVTKALIVGSDGVVSDSVADALPVSQVTRLAGEDQFATSAHVVAESHRRGLPENIVFVANGNEPMHGALLGSTAARTGGLMVLTPEGDVAAAETVVRDLNLCVDRLMTSDLTGTATVANDPPDANNTVAGPVGSCGSLDPELPPEASSAATFAPLSPARVWDSRSGPGPTGRIGAGQTRDITVAGVGGVPAVGATAVVLNVTAVSPSVGTFVTVWPTGEPRPLASNLNIPAGDTRPNLVTVKVGAGGQVSFFNDSGTVDLVADVSGWYGLTAGQRYTPLSPSRVWDSRVGPGPVGRLGAAQTRDVPVTGTGGVPFSGVTAVVLNVTAVSPTAGTFVTAFPTGEGRPLASNLNLPAGDTRPNLVVVKVGAGGKISFFNNAGSTDLIADVAGYFGATGSKFIPVSPFRMWDTRFGPGPLGRSAAGESRDVSVTNLGGVPATGVAAVVLNVTSVVPSANTFVTVWPTGEGKPTASNLNTPPGDTRPNLVIVKVGAGGKVSVYNEAGTVDLIADVAGWFGSPGA